MPTLPPLTQSNWILSVSRLTGLLTLALGLGAHGAVEAGPPISFRNDVMAVLSKSGCNLGTCHGNARGKGGFQISLRGQDPAGDFQVLTRDWQARRTNTSVPDRSLVLLKATMQVAHEGGRRFAVDSPEYRVLRDWIAAGLPADADGTRRLKALTVEPSELILTGPDWKSAVRVTARYSDGAVEDVTSKAVYEVAQPVIDVSADGEVRGWARGNDTAGPAAAEPDRRPRAAAARRWSVRMDWPAACQRDRRACVRQAEAGADSTVGEMR